MINSLGFGMSPNWFKSPSALNSCDQSGGTVPNADFGFLI